MRVETIGKQKNNITSSLSSSLQLELQDHRLKDKPYQHCNPHPSCSMKSCHNTRLMNATGCRIPWADWGRNGTGMAETYGGWEVCDRMEPIMDGWVRLFRESVNQSPQDMLK